MTIQVKIKKIREDFDIPNRATSLSAGYDLRANLNGFKCTAEYNRDGSFNRKYIALQPLQRIMIPTGIALQVPEQYEIQVRPRSGLAIKHGLTLINCVGTIDADFIDEICLLVVNLSNEVCFIEDGMRLAQAVFSKHEVADFEVVEELQKYDRSGGFGSTGTN